MEHIIDYIQKANKIAITSHTSPDGDAIGSAIALGRSLKKIDKQVHYIMEEAQSKFDFLDDIQEFKEDITVNFDLGICVDCSNTDHLSNSAIMEKCDKIINIDHHISNEEYGDINYVDSSASATGEIIYRLIKKLKIFIDEEISNSIYTAIVTDTGNFKYSNVTSETHKIVSELYNVSDNFHEINRHIFDEHPFERLKLIGKALDGLYLIQDGKISIISLTLEDIKPFENVDVEGLVNYARDIIGVKVAIFIKEVEDKVYKVSLRSNTNFDVSQIALQFGGGGHSKAAGCTICEDNINAATEKLVKSMGDLV